MIIKTLLICFVVVITSASIPRPRGVADSNASHYQPNSENVFACLDGSQTFPYTYVNDDYCDCTDGSDEPGTSACPNGKFTCTNAGHRPLIVPASRVNDGVCDCCDGTDEYSGNIACVDSCKELGKKHKEEVERIMKQQEEGMKKKQEFAEAGKKMKEEKKARLEQLQGDKEAAEAERQEMEIKKNEAEVPEKEAKDKHQAAWDEDKARRTAEKDLVTASAAFQELDSNNDNFVDVLEMVIHNEFDIDSNGVVSEEEVKEHLEEADKVDEDTFVTKIWPNIKQIYKSLVPEPAEADGQAAPPAEPQGETAPPPGEETKDSPNSLPPPPLDPEDDYEEDEEEEGEDDEEEDDLDGRDDYHDPGPSTAAPVMSITGAGTLATLAPTTNEIQTEEEGEDKMPAYDEETQVLIEAADAARNAFNAADEKLQSINREITSLQSYMNLDFGNDEEFSELKDKCFEYTDREYTYKLCTYERASQRPKAGGTETSLGNWGRWSGPDNDRYSSQLYERGQNCWNGPDRSVKVHFKCGPENQLINAYEPSRCEYAFDFVTPVSCSGRLSPMETRSHDEL
ncbi:glucosidase 2 subunit beta-like isoform X2 [Mizuhopecten yessoensis]|uniref:glucosidase 2 subunit beta-like isoform X2 n=1 Tax=Mizuhopecten yessoensis TaxID=6573 RepID=UPI000B45C819|nr:glucosidase 2 subunit beta-like isoform X2 [Mizuhopecten yessoensis]